ncbi:hypothetical protein KO561_11150 [Radiobacillus kanasensis]|uniref:hypothetical protein n=1 Tax=Radiobacillus kanasensis TaxID=2844358 RepID=UPI001E2BE845|nr:hypothetical protein [Radiobacillus kanasensis]UFT97779.1 hypothetical protein KO561_11150 [Radiobacillus kanasensis]
MNRGIVGLIVIFTLFLATLIMDGQGDDTSAIKHFPIDKSLDFTLQQTDLKLLSQTGNDAFNVLWKETSEIEKKVYLRQDVSVLYVDGRLRGVLSEWKENIDNISQETVLPDEGSSHFQAITFHHGELHYPDDKIKSIHGMSKSELYVIDSPHSALESFQKPEDQNQQEWMKTLNHATAQQLSYHWKQLLKHFQIPASNYHFVPLTNLYRYQDEPIPSLTMGETDVVIGQLWEGLYKNYILDITSQLSEDKPVKSFVPLVLFDKEGTHLMVLFQDAHGQKQQLLQYYPSSSKR